MHETRLFMGSLLPHLDGPECRSRARAAIEPERLMDTDIPLKEML